MQPEFECVGFANDGGPDDTISRVMESLHLTDNQGRSLAGILRLCTVDGAAEPERILNLADKTPEGQLLWVFSPTSRRLSHPRLRMQHVPSGTPREFVLKVGRHIERFIEGQPAGGALRPPSIPYPETIVEYEGVHSYAPKVGERHIARVNVDGVPFEMMSDLKAGSRHLVVFGQDALTRSTTELPKFFRWSWSTDLECSVLVLNDPTLYRSSDLDAGWWVGTPERDYVREGVVLVEKAADANGLRAENVLFVGASAGGFSSLAMASALPGSRALVDIPQVDLRRYSPASMADAAVSAGLGFATTTDVPPHLLHRIDIIERFAYEGHTPGFSYFQNLEDITHVEPQFEPFKKRLGGAPTGSRFDTYSATHLTKGGHFPLARRRLVEEIIADLNTMS